MIMILLMIFFYGRDCPQDQEHDQDYEQEEEFAARARPVHSLESSIGHPRSFTPKTLLSKRGQYGIDSHFCRAR